MLSQNRCTPPSKWKDLRRITFKTSRSSVKIILVIWFFSWKILLYNIDFEFGTLEYTLVPLNLTHWRAGLYHLKSTRGIIDEILNRYKEKIFSLICSFFLPREVDKNNKFIRNLIRSDFNEISLNNYTFVFDS